MPEEEHLTQDEADSFAELCNIGFGAPANELTGRLKGQVKFAPPKVSVVDPEDVAVAFQDKPVVCRFAYRGDYQGEWLFALDIGTAENIAGRMLEKKIVFAAADTGAEGPPAVLSMMQEIMNMGQSVLSDNIKKTVAFEPGQISIERALAPDMQQLFPDGIVKIIFRFKVADVVDSTMVSFVAVSFAKATVADFEAAIMSQMAGFDESAATAPATPDSGATLAPIIAYCQKHFGEFDRVAAIKVVVAVRLAAKKMSLRQLWNAGNHDWLLKFDRAATAPVELVFGARVIARGRVVTTGERFGLSITEVKR